MRHVTPSERPRPASRVGRGVWIGAATLVTVIHLQIGALAQPEPQHGGTLLLSTSSQIGVIDPTRTQATFLIRIANNVYSSLARYLPGTWEVVEDLAVALPDVSDDGLTYTFRLRPDLTFHDGTPITSGDVVFSLERAASDISVWRSRYQGVASIEAEDATTIVITLRQPDPFFIHRIAGPSSAVLPKHAVEQFGEDFASTVATTIGSGPFMLTEKSDTELVFEPHPNAPPAPYVERVVMTVIPDQTTEALEFDAGNVDWIFSILNPDIEARYAADARFEGSLRQGLSSAAFWIGLNPEAEPFDDIRVRQAIAHTLDRAPIVAAGGQGLPGFTLIHPTLPGHDADANPYATDLEEAGRLLGEAGYSDGLTFDLHVWNIPGFVAMAEVMQQQLARAGHRVTLRVTDFATMVAEAPRGTYGAFFNLGNIFVPDPAEFIHALFHSSGGLNVRYQNPEVDRLLDEAVAAPDAEAKARLAAEAERLILQDAVAIPYQFRVTATLFQPWIHGHESTNPVEGAGQTALRWSDIWIDLDALPAGRR